MTFSTAMNLRFDGIDAEVDFLAWARKESLFSHSSPELIVGETKSLGKSTLLKSRDLSQLKAIVRKLPGAIIVISVMREKFLRSEIKLLLPFVTWGRRPDEYGQPSNPVILLTGIELFAEHPINAAWEELGGAHKKFADYRNTMNIFDLADATQQIYLGMPSFYDWEEAEWKKRAARKKKAPKI